MPKTWWVVRPAFQSSCSSQKQKRIPPATGSKAALRDPTIELDISSKALTDTGCVEVARGLLQTYLGNHEDNYIIWLEELNLSDNGITPASLWTLSKVVRLACDHLKEFDLSDNALCIKSVDDAHCWEYFLRSLSKCCLLRKLDLSGNDIGCKGFEILTRSYGQEPPLDFVLPSQLSARGYTRSSISASIEGLENAISDLSIGPNTSTVNREDTTKIGKSKSSKHGALSHPCPVDVDQQFSGPRTLEHDGHSTAEEDLIQIYSTTKGLRSVPYIVLSDTSIDDTSALHLSYIIANHHTPDQLLSRVPPAKAGAHAQQLLAYDSDTGCRGVVYLPNETLSNAASRVLELAEKSRRSLQDGPKGTQGQADYKNLTDLASSSARSAVYGHRRRSSTTLGDETQEADLDRARSRIQGSTIEKQGHQVHDLWRVSFKMLSVSRIIRPQQATDLSQSFQTPKPRPSIIRTLDVPGLTTKKSNPWGTPLAPKSVNQVMSQRATPKKQSLSENQRPLITAKSFLRVREHHDPSTTQKFYRSKLPCGFPENVWSRILGYAVGAGGLMSFGQQKSVLRYAMDRETLKKEREALGLKEAAQKWHILCDMDCLAYEIR